EPSPVIGTGNVENVPVTPRQALFCSVSAAAMGAFVAPITNDPSRIAIAATTLQRRLCVRTLGVSFGHGSGELSTNTGSARDGTSRWRELHRRAPRTKPAFSAGTAMVPLASPLSMTAR